MTPSRRKRTRRQSDVDDGQRFDHGGNIFHVHGGGAGCSHAPSYSKRRAASMPPSSSPIRLGSSQSTATVIDSATLINQFFDWCRLHADWGVRRAEVLDQMKEMFLDEDYDLEGIEAMDKQEWSSKGLKEGHLARIRKSIKIFRLQLKGMR